MKFKIKQIHRLIRYALLFATFVFIASASLISPTVGSLQTTLHPSILSPGSLDPTFGHNGKVTTSIGSGPGSATATALQTDGKIVALGTIFNGTNHDFGVVRFNKDGSLDSSFDGDGNVMTDLGSDFDVATAIAIQPDGKIVAVGWTLSGLDNDFALIRYDADGSLDTTFGTGGKVIANVYHDDQATAVVIQPDGRIVVAGFGANAFGESYPAVLARFHVDGTLDTSFGSDGIIFPFYLQANAVAIQSDGKIVVAGMSCENPCTSFDFGFARINSDGSHDISFDGDGIATVDFGSEEYEVFDIAVQSNGKIIACGRRRNSSPGFILARLNANGSLDSSFDNDGKVVTSFNVDTSSYAVAVQSNGRIVAAGGPGDFALARYNANGSLDSSFDEDGKVTTDFGGNDQTSAIAIQSDGRIVAVGGTSFGIGGFAVARYIGDEVAPYKAKFDYDADGKTDASVFRPSTNEWHIMQSGGGIRVQGWGLAGDKMAPADFDGDGKTDIAVFRPAEGNWYVTNSSNNTVTVAGWGLAADKLVPGDYNGDGKADFVVFRENEGRWYRRDTDGQVHVQDWGLPGDNPAPADFDGDGRLDLTVFRPSEGRWYTIRSSDAAITTTDWGVNGDIPVAADYSGDGKADFVVFRPSDLTWYRRHSDDNSLHFITWGLVGDIPVPGDFDGDGKTDLAVFRPSNGTWYVFGSPAGIYSQPFGLNGDIPTPSAFGSQ